MESPLGLLMANIIMTEPERVVDKDLFNKDTLSSRLDTWMICYFK